MKPTIFFIGSGIGKDLRGFEAHILDLFDHVKNDTAFNSYLIKSYGSRSADEIVIRSIGRKSRIAKAIGFIVRRNSNLIQQLSFLAGLIPMLYKYKPEVLYLGEPALFNYIYHWRSFSGLPFRMIFFTGGNTVPLKMSNHDLLQLVTPVVIPLAIQRGITREQMILLPHFVDINSTAATNKKILRRKLGIPENRLVLLSIGAIDASVKRMDYLIEEVARLDLPYFLLMLGEFESETPMIHQLAEKRLGKENFMINRVERSALADYYNAADIFILASLNEGLDW